jgi:hypothetical protein
LRPQLVDKPSRSIQLGHGSWIGLIIDIQFPYHSDIWLPLKCWTPTLVCTSQHLQCWGPSSWQKFYSVNESCFVGGYPTLWGVWFRTFSMLVSRQERQFWHGYMACTWWRSRHPVMIAVGLHFVACVSLLCQCVKTFQVLDLRCCIPSFEISTWQSSWCICWPRLVLTVSGVRGKRLGHHPISQANLKQVRSCALFLLKNHVEASIHCRHWGSTLLSVYHRPYGPHADCWSLMLECCKLILIVDDDCNADHWFCWCYWLPMLMLISDAGYWW